MRLTETQVLLWICFAFTSGHCSRRGPLSTAASVLEALGQPRKIAPDRRTAPDGMAYARDDFIKYFGEENGTELWDAATEASPETPRSPRSPRSPRAGDSTEASPETPRSPRSPRSPRAGDSVAQTGATPAPTPMRLDDGQPFSQEGFIAFYGKRRGSKKWKDAPKYTSSRRTNRKALDKLEDTRGRYKVDTGKPLQVCQGACRLDEDCADALECFVRSGYSPVPGCSGRGVLGRGYCYDKNAPARHRASRASTARGRRGGRKSRSRKTRPFWFETNDVLVLNTDVRQLGAANTVTQANAGSATLPPSLQIVTWNLLASPYVRLEPTGVEKESREDSEARMLEQMRILEETAADVILLQEFWIKKREYREHWNKWAAERDYVMYSLQRTGGKADGCVTLVRSMYVPHGAAGIGYNDSGNRVALEVRISTPGAEELRIINTHWGFAHDRLADLVQREFQARKLVKFLDQEQDVPVLVAGDLNGNHDEVAVRQLSLAGFQLMNTLRDAKPQEFVSHFAHTGASLGCDFVAARGGPELVKWKLLGSQVDIEKEGRISDHLPVVTEMKW